MTARKLIFAPGEEDGSSHRDDGVGGKQDDAATGHTDEQSERRPSRRRAGQFGSTGHSHPPLHRSHLHGDPLIQFHEWFTDPSLKSEVPETCTLSTAHLPSGRVSSRIVYLKELDAGDEDGNGGGFVVYSNWGTSQKARDLDSNPHVSLCFWWKPVERQVRIEGVGVRLPQEQSQIYFDTRKEGSKIGAWASRQSQVLRPQAPQAASATSVSSAESTGRRRQDDGRAELDDQVRQIERRFGIPSTETDSDGGGTTQPKDAQIPVPPFWGGLRIIPDTIEFWQGRDSRLHDRFRYTKTHKAGNGESGTAAGNQASWKIERLSP